jgi:hypothetical protein
VTMTISNTVEKPGADAAADFVEIAR